MRFPATISKLELIGLAGSLD